MNAFLRSVGFVLVALVLVTLRASAQECRWVRGTATAMTDDALTVYLAGSGLHATFVMDQSPVVVARGPGTTVRPPERVRATLSEVVRLGDPVDVHYTRKSARNHSRVIRLSVRPAHVSSRW